MRDYTLIFAKADKDSGVSIVKIGTDLGEFEGVAECCAEDAKHFSNYFGCRIAELRAGVKYAKAKIKYYRARLDALESYEGTMCATRNWNDQDYYVKKLFQHIKNTEDQITLWKNIYERRQERIKKMIVERDRYILKMEAPEDDSIYG